MTPPQKTSTNMSMDTDFADKIIVFTDGACSGNPGKGGWGAVIAYPEGRVKELGGYDLETTNNRMEMMATIRALETLKSAEEKIWLYTDSTYVIRGITQWIWGWKKKGWISSEGQPVTNQDLWLRLEKAVTSIKKTSSIGWKYVRGHTGVPGNERVDEIAVCFTKYRRCDLYEGPLLNYSFAIYDLPEDTELPPMREKKEKKAAFSYLSLVNGVLERHATWPDCEARVKGRSGAKFKKTMSENEEKEVIKSWGMNPDQLKK